MSSCVDTIILPENKTLDEDFWKKKSEVESVVATAYAQLRDGGTDVGTPSFQRNYIIWSDFRSDELVIASDFKSNNRLVEQLTEINSMQIQPNNTFTTWYPLYSCINYCNLVLEKGEGVMKYDPDYTKGDWEANQAQVTALRAFCYFTLVRVFRDIPVTPHAYFNSSEDLTVEQSAPSVVLEKCINDLLSVVDQAPTNSAYGIMARDRGYFNKDAINALLADIYLWRASVNHDENDYKKCVEYCDKVIQAKHDAHKFNRFDADQTPKDYYLQYKDFYSEIFGQNGQNSEESILELQYMIDGTSNNALMQLYYGYSSNNSGHGYLKATGTYGDYNASSSQPNVFKNTEDQRLWEWTYNVNEGMDQHLIRKFVAKESRPEKTSEKYEKGKPFYSQNWILYRLTDIMLMKAEALVQIGGDDNITAAFNLVKAVNDRAINDNATYALKQSTYSDRMEELVLQERARELCFEGKRWFDLMRYNYRHMTGVDYTKKLSELGGNFSANSDEFYEIALNKYTNQSAMKAKMPSEPYLYMPLNEEELQFNTKLVQNPVYKATSK